MSEINALVLALIGGIVPAFFWLWFWIREDRLKPEPKSAIFGSFFGGMVAVLLALFFELIIYYLLVDADPTSIKDFPNILKLSLQNFSENNHLVSAQNNLWGQITAFDIKKLLLVVIIAPITEELLKFILTYFICLRRKFNDEPIDAAIYMLTTALGFAAVETTLFLIDPLAQGNIADSLIAGNFRSFGPMLIHLVSSATLGLFMGLAFYKTRRKKALYLTLGLFLAILLHAIFNFFIMLNDSSQNTAFFWVACVMTWVLVIALLAFFERVKKVSNFINKLTRKN